MKWILLLLGVLIHNFLGGQNQLAVFKPSLEELKIEAPIATDQYSNISFQLINKMIHVRAIIDGQAGLCIIDTGSPSVILNRQGRQECETVQAATLASEMKIYSAKINHISLGELRFENISGLAIPFNEFAADRSEKILGLLGYGLLKNHEILFDFQNHLLHLFPLENAAIYRSAQPQKRIRFSMEGHLPVINVKVGDRKLRFGLDTGAAVNVIDAALLNELPQTLLRDLDIELLRCLDGQYQKVESAMINQLSLEDYPLQSMKFLFVDMSTANQNTNEQLDGLLGYDFFSQLLCSINYQNQMFNIWERGDSNKAFK